MLERVQARCMAPASSTHCATSPSKSSISVVKVSNDEFAELMKRLQRQSGDGGQLQLTDSVLSALHRSGKADVSTRPKTMNITKVQIIRKAKSLTTHEDGSVSVKREAVAPLASDSKLGRVALETTPQQARAQPGPDQFPSAAHRLHTSTPCLPSLKFELPSPVSLPILDAALATPTAGSRFQFPTPPFSGRRASTNGHQLPGDASPLPASRGSRQLSSQDAMMRGSVFLTPQSLKRSTTLNGETCRLTPGGEPCRLTPGGEPCQLTPGGEPCRLTPGSEPCRLTPDTDQRRLLSTPCGNIMFCSPSLSPLNPLTSTPTASAVTPTTRQPTTLVKCSRDVPNASGIAPSSDKMLNLMQLFSEPSKTIGGGASQVT